MTKQPACFFSFQVSMNNFIHLKIYNFLKNIVLFKILIIVLITTSSSSCGSIIETNGYDLARWKNDKLGCEGFRKSTVSDFTKAIKPQLEGYSETQIVANLGQPDFRELYNRSQKFYYYQLEKGEQCKSSKFNKKAMYLQVRINALNYVSGSVIIKP